MTASFSTARAGVRVAWVALIAVCGSCDGVGATHAESEGTAQGQDDCVTASSSSPGAPKGHAITVTDGKLQVPADPVIPYIEGDGIGPFIWAAAQKVIDAAVAKAYKGTRAIDWRKLEGGEQGLPEQTLTDFDKYIVGIKGPLGTPVGGGRRSLNVELRQKLDLYVCLRPFDTTTACQHR